MALDPQFFILPAAGVATAVFAVWATTRTRVDRLDGPQAAGAIEADLLVDPPAEVFVGADGRCAFAPLSPEGIAVAWMSGDRIATRLVRAVDARALRREPGCAGRVLVRLQTQDFDRAEFQAEIEPAAAQKLAAALAPAAMEIAS